MQDAPRQQDQHQAGKNLVCDPEIPGSRYWPWLADQGADAPQNAGIIADGQSKVTA